MRDLWQTRSGFLSMQVLNEYYVNVTQKLKPGLTKAEAWSDLEALDAWEPIPISSDLPVRGYHLQARYALALQSRARAESVERISPDSRYLKLVEKTVGGSKRHITKLALSR